MDRALSGRACLFAILSKAKEPVLGSELVAQLVEAGFSSAVGYQAISAGFGKKQLVRHGDSRPHKYSLAADASGTVPGAGAAEPAVESVPSGVAASSMPSIGITASLGLVCDSSSGKRAKADVRGAIEQAFEGDDEFTIDEVYDALSADWARAEILGEIASGVVEGWLGSRLDRGSKASVYWLQTAVAPAPMQTPSGLAQAAPHQLDTALRPLGIRERIEAVATDIEQCLGDAVDSLLPHGLIKALVDANGATQRALRQLAT